MKNSSIMDRFNEKYCPEPNTGCWLWTGASISSGYGHMRINGKNITAHRLSYEMHIEPISVEDAHVCHACDVKLCVNPSHLFLSDRTGNMKDMADKGRAARGESSAAAKLTERDVKSILCDARSHGEIAEDFGVSRTHIGGIKRGEYWRHISRET